MKYITLNTGNQQPALGFGTYQVNDDIGYHAIREAITIGFRHFDCAHFYKNEKIIGKALADALQAGEVTRDELFITSKLWNDEHAPDDVLPALKTTLNNLQLEYLDLYLIHWPVATIKGIDFADTVDQMISLDNLPLSSTWSIMEKAAQQGFTKNIGVSNFSAKKLQALCEQANTKPAVNQVELHPYLQQPELFNYCQSNNIALTAYSPLGPGGRSYETKDSNEPIVMEDPTIINIAKKHHASPAQILIAWSLKRGHAAIPKSVNPKRIKENYISQFISLDDEDMQAIKTLDRHYRYVNGDIFFIQGSDYSAKSLWDE